MKAGDIHTKPRDSFSAIPHDPPLRRNDGSGLFFITPFHYKQKYLQQFGKVGGVDLAQKNGAFNPCSQKVNARQVAGTWSMIPCFSVDRKGIANHAKVGSRIENGDIVLQNRIFRTLP
jgi:hypothetical protein